MGSLERTVDMIGEATVAVFQDDGRLVASGDELIDRVDARSAVPAVPDLARLSIRERDDVLLVDPDGKTEAAGGWTGCETAIRTCMVTPLLVAVMESHVLERKRLMYLDGPVAPGTRIRTGADNKAEKK